MKKKFKYTNDLPRRMYTFFNTYSDTASAPSFSKFARSVGTTLDILESFKGHGEFMKAWRECNEIRRDYLIDTALGKRFDSSLVKFLLASEFGMGEKEESSEDKTLKFTLEVIGEENGTQAVGH